MGKLFDMENPFMKTLSTAADLLVLNLLTLVMSLPLITLGCAVTAMNSVVISLVRSEEGYLVKAYFSAFRANLRKGVLLGLLLEAALAFLCLDYLAALSTVPLLRVGVFAIGLLVLAAAIFSFALLARYENTLGGTLKNALALAVAFFPRTLLMLLFTVGFWLACIHFYQFGIPLLLLFGLALPCYVNNLLLKEVFHTLEEKPTKE